MSAKSKGSNAERDLVHKFWSAGWTALRVAGSGSSKYPSPDVLASNGNRRVAIECKASAATSKYLTSKEVEELMLFARSFGAEAWIGIRFNNTPWYFLSIEDLHHAGVTYSVSKGMAQKKGLLFEELIS